MSFEEYLTNIKQMIDELKSMSASLGLANTGDEYKIISELFTYKFLNDKLLYEFDRRDNQEETFEEFVDFSGVDIARMREEHLINNLWHRQNEDNFNVILDKAFIEVNELNKDIYTIETTSGKKKALFEALSTYIRDENKELELAKRAINILARHQFKEIYDGGFDYFSTIFEYLIKDYNKDSGKYAEFFTPPAVADIISDILVNNREVRNVNIYDPAAGSGTLLLSLANKIGTNNCTIYSQDISQKSTQFLRINLMLNKLAHSLSNVVEGDTLTMPSHLSKNSTDELRKFHMIVSNPPFKTDFSSSIEALKVDKFGRFFAGLPNIPKKDKKGMAIYETFMQHIIASLEDNGKAAIVVPTGFTTSTYKIPTEIRKKLVKENWLTGVIHMPSNIFATTDTSVSVIFIDKNKDDSSIYLMDASNLGTSFTLEDGKRVILSEEEKEKVISKFKGKIIEPEFSALVTQKMLKENKYQLQAGQYVELKEEPLDYNLDDKIKELKISIIKTIKESKKTQEEILELLKEDE